MSKKTTQDRLQILAQKSSFKLAKSGVTKEEALLVVLHMLDVHAEIAMPRKACRKFLSRVRTLTAKAFEDAVKESEEKDDTPS